MLRLHRAPIVPALRTGVRCNGKLQYPRASERMPAAREVPRLHRSARYLCSVSRTALKTMPKALQQAQPGVTFTATQLRSMKSLPSSQIYLTARRYLSNASVVEDITEPSQSDKLIAVRAISFLSLSLLPY